MSLRKEPPAADLILWYPIETAPRDGTVIDVWALLSMARDGLPKAGFLALRAQWNGERWVDKYNQLVNHPGDAFARTVTHWTPDAHRPIRLNPPPSVNMITRLDAWQRERAA